MPRRSPPNYAGAWWHVTNRGITKRTVLENGHDVEQFLALLAAVVEAGWLEVHAFAILTTHFHLRVRSLCGELPRALRWLLLSYVRWFNRARKRDGSLFRGRYKARLIEDDVYWETVVRYIDLNPVRARTCTVPSAYARTSVAARSTGTIVRSWPGSWISSCDGRFPRRCARSSRLPDGRAVAG